MFLLPAGDSLTAVFLANLVEGDFLPMVAVIRFGVEIPRSFPAGIMETD